MIGQGARELIEEAGCGYAVPAGDFKAFARLIKEDVLPNVDEFKKKGQNGRDYYLNNFTVDKCISDLERIISD